MTQITREVMKDPPMLVVRLMLGLFVCVIQFRPGKTHYVTFSGPTNTSTALSLVDLSDMARLAEAAMNEVAYYDRTGNLYK